MTEILGKLVMSSSQTCSQCKNNFATKKRLLIHETRVHGSKLSCDMCTFKTVRKDKLENHKRARHSDEQLIFDCDQCQKPFGKKDNLKIHKDVIHKGKVISCDLCDFKTGYLFHLKAHKERVHQKKSFECTNCKSSQSGKAALKYHIKYMCGKIFKCNYCDHENKTLQGLSRSSLPTPSGRISSSELIFKLIRA